MAQILLTQGRVAIVDDDRLEELSKFTWFVTGNGYAYRKTRIGNSTTSMHHAVLPRIDGFDVDHINGNRLDNRKENLRYATRSQNLRNRGAAKHSKSGIKGVYFHRATGKWRAEMKIDGKSKHLGLFETKELAHAAYQGKAVIIQGEFARRENP